MVCVTRAGGGAEGGCDVNSPLIDRKPSAALIAHEEVRHILRRSSIPIREDEFRLHGYVTQCEATSRDMRATIDAVLALWGPEGLRKVQARVEAARPAVPGRRLAS